ncbi:metal-dependent hydrolase [Campylobacter sp. MIT 19-121]|uniref:aminofutalosine deaminase family hydrolase n=1 Tax=Campylobacter sp. MIT 19-121 TaxID=2703906 RepID=UPI001389CE13|nr:metal-dependent hydrolase [Campylobacter sp. MIT 19-121]NDJ27403.1 metal-dependent hydrolase [Campylobacter sp. MIT 19-121]
MFLIKARYIFVCDEAFTILENKALCFDEKIIELGEFEKLALKYPQAKLIQTPPNSLILPAFINPHTHLEFSANAYTLHYGDFLVWLKSVINARSNLSQKAKEKLILNTMRSMLESGTATIGEISSFASDLTACVKSPMRVVFFNEILGVNENANEAKKQDFLKRFHSSLEHKNENFIPAISLHSPYSLNKDLALFALDLAKKYNLLVSTHFLESDHEFKWLHHKGKGFEKWLRFFEPNPKPKFSPQSFLELFKGVRTLFTHCVYVKDFSYFDKNLHFITHCAVSNRLLSKARFSLKKALKAGMNVHLGTDGLSSNISLSMLDEMRANLLIHQDFKPQDLAKELLLMATSKPAKALNLELGKLKAGKIADISVFKVQECDLKQLPLQFVLNAKKVEKIFIKGKECSF